MPGLRKKCIENRNLVLRKMLYYTENAKGKWLAYLRRDNENILVNKILLEV